MLHCHNLDHNRIHKDNTLDDRRLFETPVLIEINSITYEIGVYRLEVISINMVKALCKENAGM